MRFRHVSLVSYRWRHRIENLLCDRKQYRGIATRYAKTDRNLAAMINLAATAMALKHVPKKLFGFFDSGMLQIFEFERFHFDHVIGKRAKVKVNRP